MTSRPGLAARALLLAVLGLGPAACARVPGVYVLVHPSSGAAAIIDGGNFDAGQYVSGIWSAKVLPAFRARAISAQVLIAGLTASPAKTCARYGNVPAQDSPCAFMVKGTGRVADVTSSLNGTELTVTLAGGTVSIDVGPAFTGTAVRDALSFIKFAQYTNQVDYADVGIELNNLVRTRVIRGASFTSARGHSVTFLGATEGSDPKAIVITPVQLSVGPS